MLWPDPPMCCQHGPNVHARDRCQSPGCGCTKDTYLTQRQMVLAQRAAAPPAPPPQPPVDWRWRLVAHLDNTLEVELNRDIFGDTEAGADAALAEVVATAAELGAARPAEDDDV